MKDESEILQRIIFLDREIKKYTELKNYCQHTEASKIYSTKIKELTIAKENLLWIF